MKKKLPVFKLSAEEKKLEEEIAKGEWAPIPRKESQRIRKEMITAAQSRAKEARVNLRLNPEDVEKIRKKAQLEGIPYQTLIGSVLHKYATDQFIEEKALEAVVKKMKKIAS